MPKDIVCDVPSLFIRGENSNYILDDDINLIQEIFPNSILETIDGAGHWLHAEKPQLFLQLVRAFLCATS